MCAVEYYWVIFVLFFGKSNSNNLKLSYLNTEHNFKSEPIVSCIADIVQKFYEKRTLMFLKNEMFNSVGEHLIKSGLNASSIIISSTNQKDKNYGFYILQPYTGIVSDYTEVLKHSDKTSCFLLIWKQDTTMFEMEKVHDKFWNLHLLRVVSVVPLKNGNSDIYMYIPYGLNHCNRSGIPVKVDFYSQNKFLKSFKLFSTIERLRNFYGCPLNCVGNNQPPEITVYQDANGFFQTDGQTIALINIFKNHFNFTPVLVNVFNDRGGWFFYNESVQSRMLTYKNHTIDFGFGTFSLLELNLHPDIDHAFPIYPECFCFGVPIFSGNRPSILSNFVKEFSATTWILLMLSYFVATICIYFISRKLEAENVKFQETSRVMMYLFGLILGQSITVNPKTRTLKLFIILWSVWMLSVHTAYETSLGSFMTVPTPVQNIKSTKEIVKKGLRLAGGIKIHSILKNLATNKKILKTAWENFEILPPLIDGEEIFEQIYKNRDLAVLFPKRYLVYFGTNYKFTGSHDKVHIVPECIVKTYASPLISRRGTPISFIINRFLQITFQSGLTKFMRMKLRVKPARLKVDPKKCTLTHLEGAFTLYAFGLFLASLCFIGEVILSKYY